EGSSSTFTVTVDDDAPVAFAPTQMIIANDSTSITSSALDTFGNTGADGLGGATFVGTDGTQLMQTDGVTAVTSGSPAENLLMFGFGTSTLQIRSADTDTLVMTVTLNPDATSEDADIYTVQLHQDLNDGSGVVFDDFSDAAAGLNDWVGLDGDGGDIMDDTNDSEDLLITAPGGLEINTDADDIGVSGGQKVDAGETVRLDFVVDLQRDAGQDEKDPQGYIYDSHYLANDFTAKIVEVQGSQSNTTVVGFKVFEFDDVDKKDLTTGNTQIAITLSSIVVTDVDGVTILQEGVDYDAYLDGDGTLYVDGLVQGQKVFFSAASDFEVVEIFNATGMPIPDGEGATFSGSSFAVGGFGFDTALSGSDIPLEFDITLSDGDNDTSAGTIALTVTPDDGVITGTSSNETLSGGAGNDILTGDAGDDVFMFASDDQGSVGDVDVDKIMDFNDNGEADVLDLSDLLVGEEGTDLTAFLAVSEDAGAVVIDVNPDGISGVTEQIRLEGTTLADLGATLGDPQADIISDLISNGHIQVDS
ncbi:MAG: calcium-binding protein, partial [Neptuniibacter sp.]